MKHFIYLFQAQFHEKNLKTYIVSYKEGQNFNIIENIPISDILGI